MATIELRDDRNGDRERREKSFQREREAKAWIAKQHALVGAGVQVFGSTPTVGTLLEDWLEHGHVARQWSPSHYRRSLIIVRRDLASLRRLAADELTVRQVESVLEAKRATGAAPDTVRLVRSALSAALNLAVRRGVLARNVAALSQGPRVRQTAPTFLHPNDLARFRAALEGDRLGILYRIAMRLALRPSEVIGLRWVDVDLDGALLKVEQNVQRFDGFEEFEGGYSVLEPKTGLSRRTIPLTDNLIASLRVHRKNQLEERMAARRWDDSGLVFTNARGGPLNESYVNKRLKKRLEEASLPCVTFQQLRHTGATLMLSLGAELAAIQELLGHTSINTTRRYAKVIEPLKRDAVERAAAFDAEHEGSGGEKSPCRTVRTQASSWMIAPWARSSCLGARPSALEAHGLRASL